MKMWRTLGISLIVAFALLIAVGGSALALVEKLTIENLTASQVRRLERIKRSLEK